MGLKDPKNSPIFFITYTWSKNALTRSEKSFLEISRSSFTSKKSNFEACSISIFALARRS
jgi:hypothetical protein